MVIDELRSKNAELKRTLDMYTLATRDDVVTVRKLNEECVHDIRVLRDQLRALRDEVKDCERKLRGLRSGRISADDTSLFMSDAEKIEIKEACHQLRRRIRQQQKILRALRDIWNAAAARRKAVGTVPGGVGSRRGSVEDRRQGVTERRIAIERGRGARRKSAITASLDFGAAQPPDDDDEAPLPLTSVLGRRGSTGVPSMKPLPSQANAQLAYAEALSRLQGTLYGREAVDNFGKPADGGMGSRRGSEQRIVYARPAETIRFAMSAVPEPEQDDGTEPSTPGTGGAVAAAASASLMAGLLEGGGGGSSPGAPRRGSRPGIPPRTPSFLGSRLGSRRASESRVPTPTLTAPELRLAAPPGRAPAEPDPVRELLQAHRKPGGGGGGAGRKSGEERGWGRPGRSLSPPRGGGPRELPGAPSEHVAYGFRAKSKVRSQPRSLSPPKRGPGGKPEGRDKKVRRPSLEESRNDMLKWLVDLASAGGPIVSKGMGGGGGGGGGMGGGTRPARGGQRPAPPGPASATGSPSTLKREVLPQRAARDGPGRTGIVLSGWEPLDASDRWHTNLRGGGKQKVVPGDAVRPGGRARGRAPLRGRAQGPKDDGVRLPSLA